MNILVDKYLRKLGYYDSYYVYVFKETKEPCFEVGDDILNLIKEGTVVLDTDRFLWDNYTNVFKLNLDVLKIEGGYVQVVDLIGLKFYIMNIQEFIYIYNSGNIKNNRIFGLFEFDKNSDYHNTIKYVGEAND